ncbi:MAG TPA: hypothetical protein DIW17_16770 [Clostridiales bacterium]|nr:hypothetical protein [Clostridiales bacterium]
MICPKCLDIKVNAEDIWNVTKNLLMEANAAVPELTAIGVTSFGESFVLLNGKGEVLMPTMMYTDPRGEVEADIRTKTWNRDIFEAACIDPGLFGKLVPSGSDAGSILPEIAVGVYKTLEEASEILVRTLEVYLPSSIIFNYL